MSASQDAQRGGGGVCSVLAWSGPVPPGRCGLHRENIKSTERETHLNYILKVLNLQSSVVILLLLYY